MSKIIFETKNREVIMDETGLVYITDKNSPRPHAVLGTGWDQVGRHPEMEQRLIEEG